MYREPLKRRYNACYAIKNLSNVRCARRYWLSKTKLTEFTKNLDDLPQKENLRRRSPEILPPVVPRVGRIETSATSGWSYDNRDIGLPKKYRITRYSIKYLDKEIELIIIIIIAIYNKRRAILIIIITYMCFPTAIKVVISSNHQTAPLLILLRNCVEYLDELYIYICIFINRK